MDLYPEAIERLIGEFSRLPSVGKKSAERLVLKILEYPEKDIDSLIGALVDVKSKVKKCRICYNYTEQDICEICASKKRDTSTICVVEDVRELIAIEKSGDYKGLYHILGGLISPLNNVLAENINIDSLIERVKNDGVKEVIIAISPTIEGEMTSLFLLELLKKSGARVSRIASGIPLGGSLEYFDPQTLGKALEDRREL